MAESTEKVIRYKIVVDPPDANQVAAAQKKANDAAKQESARNNRTAPAEESTAGGYGRGRRSRRPTSDRYAPASSRSVGPSGAPTSVGGGIAQALQALTGLGRQAGASLGPNSVFGQTLRGFGLGGGRAAHFARYALGNLNAPVLGRLIQGGGRLLGGQGTGLGLGQLLGGAAVRGAGGAIGGAGGAALVGAGPVGLAVGAGLLAIYGLKKGIDYLHDGVKLAARGVLTFGQAFITGNAANAIKGVIGGFQALGHFLGGPLFGPMLARFIGVGNRMVDGLEGLVHALGRYSPTVLGMVKGLEVQEMLFKRHAAQVFTPLMAAWLKIKSAMLDVLDKLLPKLAPVVNFLANALMIGAKAIKLMIISLSSGFARVFDTIGLAIMRIPGMEGFGKSITNVAVMLDGLAATFARATPRITESLDAYKKSIFGLKVPNAKRGDRDSINPEIPEPKRINRFQMGMSVIGAGAMALTTQPVRDRNTPPPDWVREPNNPNDTWLIPGAKRPIIPGVTSPATQPSERRPLDERLPAERASSRATTQPAALPPATRPSVPPQSSYGKPQAAVVRGTSGGSATNEDFLSRKMEEARRWLDREERGGQDEGPHLLLSASLTGSLTRGF